MDELASVVAGQDRWCVVHGDCLSVLRAAPAGSIDACVTDVPYELSDAGEASPARVAAKFLLPKNAHRVTETPSECLLVALARQIAGLCGIGVLPTPASSVPVATVALDDQVAGRQEQVEHGGPSSGNVVSDTKRWHDDESESSEYVGCFQLKLADAETLIDALHCAGASFFTGGIGIGLSVSPPGDPRLACDLLVVDDSNTIIRLRDYALALAVCAGRRAEDESVARLELFGGAINQISACAALVLLTVFQSSGAKLVRAAPTTGRLPSKLQTRRFRVVADPADRALTFDLVVQPTDIKSSGFMGKDWDGSKISFSVDLWRKVFRVLKPGAHLLVFGGTRTYHRIACAIEDAGFEIRDSISVFGWIQGSGFPKSLDVQYTSMLYAGVCLSREPAQHVVVSSRWLRVESPAGKEPIAVALAETEPGGDLVLLTATGEVGVSSVRTATLRSALLASRPDTISSTDSSWSDISAVFSDPTKTSITETVIAQTIGSEIWSSVRAATTSRNTTLPKKTQANGCKCPAARVASYSCADATSWSVIPVRSAHDGVTDPERVRLLAGVGSALKPSWEPVIIARKPLCGTLAQNTLKHGTGGLNIDACRVATDWNEPDRPDSWKRSGNSDKPEGEKIAAPAGNGIECHPGGRWPPNVVFVHHSECRRVGTVRVDGASGWSKTGSKAGDNRAMSGGNYERSAKPDAHTSADGTETVAAYDCHADCPVFKLEQQSGVRTSGRLQSHHKRSGDSQIGTFRMRERTGEPCDFGGDTGTAARFFPQFEIDDDTLFLYVAKAARAERELGCERLPARTGAEAVDREEGSAGVNNPRAGAGRTAAKVRNVHPTVKPIELMRWLVRLVTPKDGVVIDPFAGSGTTGIAALLEDKRFIGIELNDTAEEPYARIARARIGYYSRAGVQRGLFDEVVGG